MRTLVGEIVSKNAKPTVVDMEAGLEHLSRGTIRHVDVAFLVIEPYFKSMETGSRMNALAKELGIPRVLVLANKVRDQEDRRAVAEFCQARDMEIFGYIPFDNALLDAERAARSPLDYAPGSSAVQALDQIAERLSGLESRLN